MKAITKNVILFLLLIVPTLSILTACGSYKSLSSSEVAQRIDSSVAIPKIKFIPSSAIPENMGSRPLTSDYELKIGKDSVQSYLPYFGVAYTADYGNTDGGIKFETKSLNYSSQKKKNGINEIRFEAKTAKDNYNMSLSISPSGYATLSVTCNNRRPITFYGTVDY